MMNAPIILLKEGTEAKFGKQQIISNISACNVIADSVRTTLGPRGMDKLIIDSKGINSASNSVKVFLEYNRACVGVISFGREPGVWCAFVQLTEDSLS